MLTCTNDAHIPITIYVDPMKLHCPKNVKLYCTPRKLLIVDKLRKNQIL